MNAGRLQQAEDILRRHLQRDPNDPAGLYVLAATLLSRGQHTQAIFFATRASDVSPNDPDVLSVLGFALASAGQPRAAEEALRKSVDLVPSDANAWVGLGVALVALDRAEEAIPAFERAIALDPTELPAFKNLAICHARFGNANEALRVLRSALKHAPHDEDLLLQAASMSNYADSLSVDAVRAAHIALARSIEATVKSVPPIRPLPLAGRPLRVGLLSSDLCDHSCAFFLEPLLAHLSDAARAADACTTIVCFSATRQQGATSARLRSFGLPWHDVHSLDDAACASRIRAENIDVLVDCSGYTSGSRVRLLARRLAPVQVTYLGYPNTTGLRECDFRVVDSVTDPEGFDQHCSERLLRLDPHFLCYSTRISTDLPAIEPVPPCVRTGSPTFASFNSPTKIGDACIDLWARLLREVPTSRLLLKAKHAQSRARVLGALAAKGVSAERVSILSLVDSAHEHMALYNHVDVALDTLPYNGTTTTYEALSMGVPVVAIAGDRHASRVSASILSAVGLPDLATTSHDSYIHTAARLATDPSTLGRMRGSLREQLTTSPACDAAAFARRFAKAMHWAWETKVAESS